MITYQDFKKVPESARASKIEDFISEYRASPMYRNAKICKDYAEGKNTTINAYRKLLYTVTGKAVPDNYSANHKCASGHFKRFITQEASYLLGNGVTLTDEANKEKLGKNFDARIYKGGKNALAYGVMFGFWNNDHIELYDPLEFLPLYDEENGALMAGIRFWQVSYDKPLRATLFEIDGYTDYVKKKNENMTILKEKRSYRSVVVSSVADGEQIFAGENYPSFPIVPWWANVEHLSELDGRREQIDCYDLIKSGFANDLDDASMIYWTLENAGGMDDVDLAKFVERMKVVKAAVVDGEGKATAHTLEVPYQSRETYLSRLEKDLYKDFMALDTEQIAAGNITATQIKAAYEPLNEKCDEFELCTLEFLDKIFELAGINDTPTFTRSQIANVSESVDMLLSMSEYLDDEYVTTKLLTLIGDGDKAEEVIKRKANEEINRYPVEEVEE